MSTRHARTLTLTVLATAALSSAAFAAQDPSREDVNTVVGSPAAPELLGPYTPRYEDAMLAVLFDNGPIITHPTGGNGGRAASALQTASAMTIFGFGHALAANVRVADDFTVPVGQSWNIATVTLFAYQTGAGTGASTINHVNLRIWNGVPEAAGSTIVFGDTTTNRLATSTFFNTFRTLDTDLLNTQRPVFANEVTIGTTLAAGTYWLDWQTGGTLASGPWVPPVTILGQTTTGNAMQKNGAAAAWVALTDVGPQGLPFILNSPNVTVSAISNSVDASGNGVLQPGETVTMAPTWRNTGTTAVALTGALSAFTGPAPGTYTITDGTADYGTIAPASNQSCGANCYALSVSSATRPAVHWDTTVLETVNPGGTTKTWTVHVGDSFTDVPASNIFYRFIETIFHNNVTGGCTATGYCPAAQTTREQMAVFVLTAKSSTANPPNCVPGNTMFTDVPASSPFCRWIEQLARDGVVTGCTATAYCPTAPATREQMAVFVLRTLDPALNPAACGTPQFSDVPASSPFCRWIEELARRGVVTGCGGSNYCPTASVTREQMSVFLAQTFSLALYGAN